MDECMVCHETLGPFVILEEVGTNEKRKACLACFGQEDEGVGIEGKAIFPSGQGEFDVEKATDEEKGKKLLELAAATVVSIVSLASALKRRGVLEARQAASLDAVVYSNMLNIARIAGFSQEDFQIELRHLGRVVEDELENAQILQSFTPKGKPS